VPVVYKMHGAMQCKIRGAMLLHCTALVYRTLVAMLLFQQVTVTEPTRSGRNAGQTRVNLLALLLCEVLLAVQVDFLAD
jgi:hypothetical protein